MNNYEDTTEELLSDIVNISKSKLSCYKPVEDTNYISSGAYGLGAIASILGAYQSVMANKSYVDYSDKVYMCNNPYGDGSDLEYMCPHYRDGVCNSLCSYECKEKFLDKEID